MPAQLQKAGMKRLAGKQHGAGYIHAGDFVKQMPGLCWGGIMCAGTQPSSQAKDCSLSQKVPPSSSTKSAFWRTHCARREARQPYMEGVYILPLREESSSEGLVFWLKISWLAVWNAFSTSLLV